MSDFQEGRKAAQIQIEQGYSLSILLGQVRLRGKNDDYARGWSTACRTRYQEEKAMLEVCDYLIEMLENEIQNEKTVLCICPNLIDLYQDGHISGDTYLLFENLMFENRPMEVFGLHDMWWAPNDGKSRLVFLDKLRQQIKRENSWRYPQVCNAG